MTRKDAERQVLSRAADTIEGLGIDEFFHFREFDRMTEEEKGYVRAEFEALIKELRRRGTALEAKPEKDF